MSCAALKSPQNFAFVQLTDVAGDSLRALVITQGYLRWSICARALVGLGLSRSTASPQTPYCDDGAHHRCFGARHLAPCKFLGVRQLGLDKLASAPCMRAPS